MPFARRCCIIAVDLMLVVCSVWIGFQALRLCDFAIEKYLVGRLWPGRLGLLFEPCQEDAFEMHDYSCSERINSLGFRDHETAVATSKYRIVVIGDSFTYGWGVKLEDTWLKHVESGLQQLGHDVEVLNLGKPAAGPDEYAVMAAVVVPVLKPDLVIVGCLAGDDINQVIPVSPRRWLRTRFPNLLHLVQRWKVRNARGGPPTLRERTIEDTRNEYKEVAGQVVREMSDEQKARFEQLEPAVKQVFFDGRLNPWMFGLTTGAPDYFLSTLDVNNLRGAIHGLTSGLRSIRAVARRHGARTIVLTLPEGFYVNEEAYHNVQRIGFHMVPEILGCDGADDAVRMACENAGIPFYTVSDAFRQHKNDKGLYFELDRHMTPAGHALYAELVTPIIAREIAGAGGPTRSP